MDDCVPLPTMQTLQTIEKRITERIFCQRVVRLRTSDHRELTATCTDVNGSGIGVDSDHVFAVGQRVELLLSQDRRVPMLVVYRMGQHYGLSALGAHESVLELLTKQ